MSIKHIITHVRKDENDNIIAVKTSMGNEMIISEVIKLIEYNLSYFVVREGIIEIPVKVIQGTYRKYIRTVKDGKETNNLDNLPRF